MLLLSCYCCLNLCWWPYLSQLFHWELFLCKTNSYDLIYVQSICLKQTWFPIFLGHQDLDHHHLSNARLKVKLIKSVNLRYRGIFLCLPWWLVMVFILIWPYEMSSRFMFLQIYRVCKEYLSQNDLCFKRKIMITIVFMFYGDC